MWLIPLFVYVPWNTQQKKKKKYENNASTLFGYGFAYHDRVQNFCEEEIFLFFFCAFFRTILWEEDDTTEWHNDDLSFHRFTVSAHTQT